MTWPNLSPPYATVVADPPWRFQSAATKADAGARYSTMPTDEIRAMPVADLAAPDAHLWLWAVNGMLEDAYTVVRAWGFRPITLVTWCKPAPGVGHYLRNNTEHAIFATRGNPIVPDDQTALHLVRVAENPAFSETRSVPRPRRNSVTRPVRRTVRPPATVRLGFMGLRLRTRRLGGAGMRLFRADDGVTLDLTATVDGHLVWQVRPVRHDGWWIVQARHDDGTTHTLLNHDPHTGGRLSLSMAWLQCDRAQR